MARYRDLFAAFLKGEVSPRVQGRADLDEYKQMCEEITNMIVLPQGGAKRRPGTQFLSSNETFSGVSAAKIVPFVISKTESYVIIFTNNIYSSGHPVLANGKDCGITIYSVTDGSISYPVPFEPILNSYTTFRGYTTSTQLEELQYAQFGTAVFFAQKDHVPFAIAKDATGFHMVPFWFYYGLGQLATVALDGVRNALGVPYATRNTDTTLTVTPSATTGGVTLTASAGIFNANQVGSEMRITSAAGTKTGVVHILIYTSPTSVTGVAVVSLGSTTATDNWSFSSWSNDKGWPRAISFFQNRIFYGGSATQPNAIWASRTAALGDMRQEHYVDDSPNTVTNADPFEFSIASTELDQIQWISAGKTLAIGTLGREYVAYGPDSSQGMGPLNFNFDAETAYGSKAVQPIRRDNALIFIQRSGRKAREFIFNFGEDAYKAENLMIYAEHMSNRTGSLFYDKTLQVVGQVVELVHQEADEQVDWFRDSNRGLFAMTRNKDMQITAFHYHPIGGTRLGVTMGGVLSICSVPSVDGTHDDLYMMVMRDINNSTYTYLERINREFELDNIYNVFSDFNSKPVYVDSAKIHIVGTAALVHTGWSHLIGQTVQVVADGFYAGTFVVDGSGQITLTTAAKEVIAGLGYRSLVKPVGINMGSVIGTSQGAVKTIDQVTFKFVRTIGAKYGFSIDDLLDINFRDPNAAQNSPISLFTGDKELSMPQGWDTDPSVVLVQDLPFPLEISAIVARGVLND